MWLHKELSIATKHPVNMNLLNVPTHITLSLEQVFMNDEEFSRWQICITYLVTIHSYYYLKMPSCMQLVFRTVGYSGADIRNLVNEAGIMSVSHTFDIINFEA